MSNNVRELRPRPADTEKITINLGFVDLGHVDGFREPISFGQRSATSSNVTQTSSSSPLPEKVWTSVCGTTAGSISKRRGEPARCCTSMFWALQVSPTMSRPNLLARQLPRSRCWGHCTPVLRSRRLSPTGCGEGDAEPGHSSRSHTPHARGPTRRGHRTPSAHAWRRERAIAHQRAHRSCRTRAANH